MSAAQHDTLAGGGEMGERIRGFDWASTPLGPIERWPQSLKTALSLILNAQMPMWLGWTPEMYFFYNDAYVQVLSHAKHPSALGRPAPEVWKEIWHVCGPLADRVFAKGEAPFVEDVRLFMDRGSGFFEEVYYSFSYSPIRDESGQIAGLFCPNTEVTAKLLNARRLRTLSELSERALVEKTIESATASAVATLAKNPDDVPFVLVYLANERGELVLREAVNADVDVRWPIEEVFATGKQRRVDLDGAVREALVLPIASTGQTSLGVMVAGVSAARRIDVEYRTFFELVAGQIAVAIQNALSAEETHRRADMLAEIDRAKTVFFSNVSHEFRTPLTLMIGPTEDALASPARALTGDALETVYRNELRLLKLVNGLLDFSRIEAGRMSASYEVVDLAALTADLASGFRSAIERAGLQLVVDTPPLAHPVAVDRDMWEKIVLNLLSNALKFTLAGRITIALHATAAGEIELAVSDTGSGVPPEHVPRLFERFHRVANPHARTQEGTGIGLALVGELAKLHGGRTSVESEVGRGSTFRVTIPMHGATGEVAGRRAPGIPLARTTATIEAERWLPDEPVPVAHPPGTPRVLLADDNADMRAYVRRLLEQHWNVTAVADGEAALVEARRAPPDLVLSDVMMPKLDGFGLLTALRADAATAAIPVILVSARAGEEARVEGLSAGADDYLVKPFSARELVARVRTHLALAMARLRSQRTSEELYALLMQVPAAIMLRRGPELRCEFQNELSVRVLDQRGKTLREVWPEASSAWLAQFERVLLHGETVVELEMPATRTWGDDREPTTRYFDLSWAPWRLADGTIDGVMTVSFDVTDRVQTRRLAQVAEERRRLAFDAANIGTWRIDLVTKVATRDAAMTRMFGLPESDSTYLLADYGERIHPDDRADAVAAMEQAIASGRDYVKELRIVRPDGEVRWLRDLGRVVHDDHGLPVAFTGAAADITERKLAEDAAHAASRAKDEFLAMLGHELRNPLAPIVTALDIMRLRGDPATRERSMIERQVAHLTRLVDDLLDISRVTRGLIELERARVSIRDVVMKAIEIASPLMEQKGHHVDVALPKDLWVDGDPVRLAQVFANLLTNAARYTQRGGKIAIAAQREDARIRVEVTDNGIGIAPEMLGPIFDLFVQGGRTVARSEGGLGIGLALVRTLVGMHGGEVTAASDGAGKGSSFTVELPALDTLAAPATLVADQQPDARGIKVLVVDDNVDAAELLGEALRTFGHDVVIAHDGPQALLAIDRFRPDAAVLDIGLPVMDGYELAQRLRERGLGSCRLIALTGYGQKQDIDKSRQAGFHAHMTKPVDLRNLVRALDARANEHTE